MKIHLLISLLFISCSSILNAQDLTVPEVILSQLQTIIIQDNKKAGDSLIFKVVYPVDYDSTKTYPVLLGLSGGNQSEDIVNYCYAAWFKSNYFNNYLTILPVNSNGENLRDYSPENIKNVLSSIKNNFHVPHNNWIIVGTSNGGVATFNFIAEEPALFQGGIVIPGMMKDSLEINNSWNHLKIVLAYGDQDSENWKKGINMTKNKLTDVVKSVNIVVMKGQGHILALDFDIDFVYKTYFEEN